MLTTSGHLSGVVASRSPAHPWRSPSWSLTLLLITCLLSRLPVHPNANSSPGHSMGSL